jgi:hypothetical protein
MANHGRNSIQSKGLFIGAPQGQQDNLYISFGMPK